MVGWAGGMGCVFCPPLWRCLVHGPCILPSFCSQYLRRDSWAFAFLYLVAHHLPQLRMLCSYFQSLIVSLYFVAQRDFCPGTHTAIKVPGPRSKPVLIRWINLLTGFIAANFVQLPAILGISDQDSKESTYNAGSLRFHPWVGKIPQRRKWEPNPVFLPGESYGQRSLAGYSPWGRKSQT